MYFFQLIKKFIFSENSLTIVGEIFFVSSIIFGSYMYYKEGLSFVDTFYYLVTTATTVGYGDFSPSTTIGKALSIFYMVLSISALGILLGVLSEKLLYITEKIKKGFIMVNEEVELLIVGYPSEDKIKKIVEQLYKDKSFKDKVIVVVSSLIKEKPLWFNDYGVKFVHGLGSDIEVLERANIYNTKKALILAFDANDIRSDDFSSSTCSIIENLNPSVKTIVEKVRDSDILFKAANADVITKVTSAQILAQEILDEGAIEFEKAIFDNNVDGTQYNEKYCGEDILWKDLAIKYILDGKIPEGYKNIDDKFNYLPNVEDIIKDGAIIKYRAKKR